MTTTLKTSLLILCAIAIAFTSCKKDTTEKTDLLNEVVNEPATVELSEANFTTNSNNLLKATDANYYEAGTMEYVVNGITEATFEFNAGGQGTLNKNGGKTNKSLKGKSSKANYTKVIVSPIVKVKTCKYIVQGIIEYYDDNNKLVATIDFGDGTCDEWAVKSFPNKPDYTFSQDDWFKK